MEKFTIVSDKSENMIKEDHFYSIDDIKEMIPMLDEITYNLLFLRFNKGQLTESEIESTQIIIKRLQNNDKHFVEDFKQKFATNNGLKENGFKDILELEEVTIDDEGDDENNEKKEI